MSKRAGTVVTMRTSSTRSGFDAARYAWPATRRLADRPRPRAVDRGHNDNPVHYVRYAHARICSVLRNAAELGLTRGEDFDPRCSATSARATCSRRSRVSRGDRRRGRAAGTPPGRPLPRESRRAFHKFYDTSCACCRDRRAATDTNRPRCGSSRRRGSVLANGWDCSA
jgi:arginyl-tRNA synthetase